MISADFHDAFDVHVERDIRDVHEVLYDCDVRDDCDVPDVFDDCNCLVLVYLSPLYFQLYLYMYYIHNHILYTYVIRYMYVNVF
jgi:hypothetical protein